MQITTVEHIVVPTGEYLAEVREIKDEDGNFGAQFRWRFEILKPEEYREKTLVGWTSTSPSLKGKFVRWSSACLGRAIGPGERLDTEDLVGSKVMLVVVVKEGEDGNEFNKVDAVKLYKQTRPTPPSDEDEGEDPFGKE